MNEKDFEYWMVYLSDLMEKYLPKLAMAIITLGIGLWIISRLTKLFHKLLLKKNVEVSLISFLSGLFNIGLKVLLIISVATMVGIPTTSFVAVLGAAGLAVGLALQGSLANFAGSVLILLFKPFKVGDLIESDGVMGVVQGISILNTVLTTPDDNTAILPNGNVANNKILNYTKENNRRVDLTVGIAYEENIERAKTIITEALKKTPKVLQTPEPFVGVLGFGDSSIDLAIRPYAKSGDYWDVYFGVNEAVKKALDDNNIEIPYPHSVEIHKKA